MPKRDPAPANDDSLKAYGRLLRYALHYKGRIAIMVALSLVVGASLGSVIFAAGTAVNVIFLNDVDFAQKSAELKGQVAHLAHETKEAIQSLPDAIAEPLISWAPKNTPDRAEALLHDMRTDRQHAVQVIVTIVLGFTVLSGLARFLMEYYATTLGVYVSIRLNREMFANLLNLSQRFYDKHAVGEIVSRFTNDAFMVNKGLAEIFTRALREPARVGFMLFLAMGVDLYLTLVVMLIVSPLFLVVMWIAKSVKKAVRRSLRRMATMASLLNETARGIAIVKIFRMEDYEQRRMDLELKRLRRQRKRLARADAVVTPLTELMVVLAMGAFLLLAERRVASGTLQAGDLVILLGALAAMLDPLRVLSKVPNLIQTSAASAARVFEFIDYKPEVDERSGAREISVLRNAIRFEDVRFGYNPDQTVLTGATFDVPRGQMVALVGFSGAGKSTIVKLLPRFYDPQGGRITIDGVDIRDATLASLRGQIGMVTQETLLFSESVAANIAAGAASPDDKKVRAAAKAAHADGFVEALPEQYEAELAEGGGNLSGGQRQRMAIARAVYKDAPILILDEATSSLDSESERAILDALDHFVQGRTTLVIAHRLSTILKADKIVVLDGGRVVDEGTHAELIARDGLYRRLYRIQFAADATPEASNE